MFLSMSGQTSVEVLAKPTLLTLFCFVPLSLCYKIRHYLFKMKNPPLWVKQEKMTGASLQENQNWKLHPGLI